MAELKWHKEGERFWETGVSKGVLFVMNESGTYEKGVAWNGLTKVSESPEGAETTKFYADNTEYAVVQTQESFKGSISAFTYPEEFNACMGIKTAGPGVYVSQQKRMPFAIAYRTEVGNDTKGMNAGYKIHVIYGCTAKPSQSENETVNENVNLKEFSWDIDTLKQAVTGMEPTAKITFDSRTLTQTRLKKLTDALYGSESGDSNLPSANALVALATQD